jgi:hypothetical protein
MSDRNPYSSIIASSEKVAWRLDEVLGPEETLDFDRAFLPGSMTRVGELTGLSAGRRQLLGQLRGASYVGFFAALEQFIVPFVFQHLEDDDSEETARTRALLRFADEELKHIELFQRFHRTFERGIGGQHQLVDLRPGFHKLLRFDPLAMALIVLHIEWMTQRHYTESVRDAAELDPQYRRMLKAHWQEEAQHARIDQLLVKGMARSATAAEIDSALDEYGQLTRRLGEALCLQVELDIAALERATGTLASGEREALVAHQRASTLWTFITAGATHPLFDATLAELRGPARTAA